MVWSKSGGAFRYDRAKWRDAWAAFLVLYFAHIFLVHERCSTLLFFGIANASESLGYYRRAIQTIMMNRWGTTGAAGV